MKGSLAKAARIFDALRIKMEAGAPAPAPVAVSEPAADNAVAEVPAQVETTEAVDETPAVSQSTTDVNVSEVPAEAVATEAVVETAAETPAE
jgi:large subunit ribosomal protein L10